MYRITKLKLYMTLPTINSYGEYKSGNYGAHSLKVEFPSGLTLWYSYETIVAFREKYAEPLNVRQNDWGTTTGKHLNWIDGGAKKSRLPFAEFEEKLKNLLTAYNLA